MLKIPSTPETLPPNPTCPTPRAIRHLRNCGLLAWEQLDGCSYLSIKCRPGLVGISWWGFFLRSPMLVGILGFFSKIPQNFLGAFGAENPNPHPQASSLFLVRISWWGFFRLLNSWWGFWDIPTNVGGDFILRSRSSGPIRPCQLARVQCDCLPAVRLTVSTEMMGYRQSTPLLRRTALACTTRPSATPHTRLGVCLQPGFLQHSPPHIFYSQILSPERNPKLFARELRVQ